MNTERKPKILIVDDTKIMAKLTQKTVNSFGYDTEVRENSTRAISYVGNNDVDVILMDIELENSLYDGIDTCKAIKQRYNIPVIFITVHENASIFQDAKLCSMFDVLIKPYDEKMLKMHIDIALENKKVEGRYREFESWLEYLLDKNDKASFILDQFGDVLKGNLLTEKITDYSNHIIINKSFLNVLPVYIANEEKKPVSAFDEFIDLYNKESNFLILKNSKFENIVFNIHSKEIRNKIIGYFIEFYLQ